MDAWTTTSTKVISVEDFTKQEITGKSAQARFSVLLDNHRACEKRSVAAFGISEEYTETHQLIDELAVAVDEHMCDEAKKTLAQEEKIEADENTGKMMREEAVCRLKTRKKRLIGQESEANSPRKPTIYKIMREDNDKERQMRADHWQQKQEMHRRKKDMELPDAKKNESSKFILLD